MAGGAVIVLAPVEDYNKLLDEREAARFRRRARQLIAAEVIAFGTLMACQAFRLAMTLTISLLALSVMLVLGWLKNSAEK